MRPRPLKWERAEVPHNAQQSFDWAHCFCGWGEGGDDYELLAALAEQHNREHEGELIKCWQVSSEPDDQSHATHHGAAPRSGRQGDT